MSRRQRAEGDVRVQAVWPWQGPAGASEDGRLSDISIHPGALFRVAKPRRLQSKAADGGRKRRAGCTPPLFL